MTFWNQQDELYKHTLFVYYTDFLNTSIIIQL